MRKRKEITLYPLHHHPSSSLSPHPHPPPSVPLLYPLLLRTRLPIPPPFPFWHAISHTPQHDKHSPTPRLPPPPAVLPVRLSSLLLSLSLPTPPTTPPPRPPLFLLLSPLYNEDGNPPPVDNLEIKKDYYFWCLPKHKTRRRRKKTQTEPPKKSKHSHHHPHPLRTASSCNKGTPPPILPFTTRLAHPPPPPNPNAHAYAKKNSLHLPPSLIPSATSPSPSPPFDKEDNKNNHPPCPQQLQPTEKTALSFTREIVGVLALILGCSFFLFFCVSTCGTRPLFAPPSLPGGGTEMTVS